MKAFYFEDNGEKYRLIRHQGTIDKADDLTFIFKDLRRKMYELSPDNGAWFSCNITVFPSGVFNTSFNYDNNPGFTYQPSKEKYIDDLRKYPTKDFSIPDWLKFALEGKTK